MVGHGRTERADAIRGAAVRAAGAATGVDEFFEAVMRAVRPVLRSDVWAGFTVDPDTLLNTGGYYRYAVPLHYMPRMLDIEYREGDVNGVPELSREPVPVRLLSEAVGGARERSPRYRDIIAPLGLSDEARFVLRDRYGTWGGLTLGIGRDTPPFSPEARAVARSLTEPLGGILRRLHLSRRAWGEHPATPPPPGAAPAPALVLLDEEYTPVQFSPTAPLWLDELPAPGTPFAPDTGPARGGLSPALYGVAAAVRAPGSPGFLVSWAQTRTRGRVRLHAWHLALPGPARVAIAVEPAGPGEHIALITAAHGLTPREGEITGLVLRGHSTAEISRLADLSPYTVQEHLKSVFDKTGVRSRRDLVAALFTRHTEPALLKTATADGVTGRTGLL